MTETEYNLTQQWKFTIRNSMYLNSVLETTAHPPAVLVQETPSRTALALELLPLIHSFF